MKKAVVVLLLGFCLLASSCSNTTQLLENESLPVESSSLSIAEDSPLTYNSTPNVDSKSSGIYERVKDDWSNWADGSLNTTHGMSINLWESVGNDFGGKPFNDATIIDNDIISPFLSYRLEVEQFKTLDKASLSAIVLINDEVCNFTIDDKKSNNGILHFTSEVNIDCYTRLNVEDCNLIKGHNKITVILLVYFPQIGHSDCIHIIRSFKSDVNKKQKSSIVSTNRNEDNIKYTNSLDQNALSESSNYSFKQNKYDDIKLCSHINKGTEIEYRFINSNENKDNGIKRNVLCASMMDGNLISLFNDQQIVILPLEEKDYAFDFPIGKIDANSKYTHVSFFLVDLDDETKRHIDEHLFYTEEM